MAYPASRVGDHAQNDSNTSTGVADHGSPDTLINGRKALRKCDRGPWVSGSCEDEEWQAVLGSSTVLVNGKPLMRKGDQTKHGNCGPGKMIEGSPDLIVGGEQASVDALCAFIHGEMMRNMNDPRVRDIRSKNETWWNFVPIEHDNLRIGALSDWKDLVATGRPWDHKPVIEKTYGESAYDAASNTSLDFTIWSNIHYGFVGRAAGFDENTLLDGAGLARKIAGEGPIARDADEALFYAGLGNMRQYDQPADQEAIKIGLRLWQKYEDSGKKDLPSESDIKTEVLMTEGLAPGAGCCATLIA